MKSGAPARIGKSALTAILFAIPLQLILMAFNVILPGELKQIAPALTLVTLGFIGSVLIITGIYDKINAFGGYAPAIAFSGLVDLVSHIYMGTYLKTRSSAQAVKAAAGLAIKFLGGMIVVASIAGVILTMVAPQLAAQNLAPQSAHGYMTLVYAALTFAVIGGLGQLQIELTGMPVLGVVITHSVVGIAIALAGLFGGLEAAAQAGLICTVVDAAGGLVVGASLWMIAGIPIQSVLIVAVMATVVLMGLITGVILVRQTLRNPDIPAAGPGPEATVKVA